MSLSYGTSDIQISGVDLDWQRDNGRIPTYTMGSARLFHTLTQGSAKLLLPDCEESHTILGLWVIEGNPIQATLLKPGSSHLEPVENPPAIYFIEIPGYELLVSNDPFNHQYNLTFLTKHR